MREEDLRAWLLAHWRQTLPDTVPFRHWRLTGALPAELARTLARLPVAPTPIGDTAGRRETHNATRWFFSEAHQRSHPECAVLAAVFQSADIVAMLNAMTGAKLDGTSLRIEFCQDWEDFWLEPHTDIGAKRFTALVYLSEMDDADSLGTDLFDTAGDYFGSAPGGFNRGLVFIPGSDTWHGFRPRTFAGVRRSLIVNYVGPEWRSRHELSFPDEPVTAG